MGLRARDLLLCAFDVSAVARLDLEVSLHLRPDPLVGIRPFGPGAGRRADQLDQVPVADLRPAQQLERAELTRRGRPLQYPRAPGLRQLRGLESAGLQAREFGPDRALLALEEIEALRIHQPKRVPD